MNKSFLTTALSAVLLFGGGQQADAASWRINNNANRHAHFTDINAAMSSNDVVAGDTLYLDPGCLIASTQNVTKRVTIIGTGYFLSGTVFQGANISGTVHIKADNTKMEGVLFTNTSSSGALDLAANNIIIERCKMPNIYVAGNYCTIRQCYITSYINFNASYSKCMLCNSIINYSEAAASSNVYKPFYGTIKNATLQNNYIVQRRRANSNYIIDASFQSCNIKDNIIICPGAPNQLINNPSNCTITHNVLSCADGTYTVYPDNVCLGSADETVLVVAEGNNDLWYLPKDDSPAKGYATDGGDCGPFGGRYPYVPSGYPLGMPRFESSVVGTRPQSGQVSVNQQVTIQKQ